MVISDQKKIPEGTFEVSGKGTAMLLGAVPTLPPGAGVSLAVTDEPAGGTQSPTAGRKSSGRFSERTGAGPLREADGAITPRR